MYGGYRHTLAGPTIVENPLMVDAVEDWSRVRSPSRARRRMRQGHRQNVRTIHVPKKEAITFDNGRTFHMHPEMAAQLRVVVQAKANRTMDRMMADSIYGNPGA